jgi:hypothetical protein
MHWKTARCASERASERTSERTATCIMSPATCVQHRGGLSAHSRVAAGQGTVTIQWRTPSLGKLSCAQTTPNNTCTLLLHDRFGMYHHDGHRDGHLHRMHAELKYGERRLMWPLLLLMWNY